MGPGFPGPSWTDLKRELMEKWHELSERELDGTNGDSGSIIELIERKVGLAIDEASERFAEIASHYHLYDEPEETSESLTKDKTERVMELRPKNPSPKNAPLRDNPRTPEKR